MTGTPALWTALAATAGLAIAAGVFLSAVHALYITRLERIERRIAQGLSRAEAALKVRGEIDSALAAAQVGPALCAVGAGWAGAPSLAGWIGAHLPPFPGSSAIAGAAGLVIAGSIFTVLGLALPRRLAARRPGLAARLAAPVALGVARLLWPLTWALHGIAAGLARLAGHTPAPKEQARESEEDLQLLALSSRRFGLFGEVQRDLLAQVFGFDEPRVRDAMTPRADMACIPSTMRAKEALEAVRHLGFTRFPVCDRDKDHIVGVVHYRELVDAADAHPRRPVSDVMSPIVTLADQAPAGEALKEMLAHRVHLAVVVNEHGSTAGLVTTEDLAAALAGELPPPEGTAERFKTLGQDLFEFDGSLLVEELEDALDIDLQHPGVETIGAFVAGKLGRKPHAGDTVRVDSLRFDILDVKGARIVRLRVQKERGAKAPVRQA